MQKFVLKYLTYHLLGLVTFFILYFIYLLFYGSSQKLVAAFIFAVIFAVLSIFTSWVHDFD